MKCCSPALGLCFASTGPCQFEDEDEFVALENGTLCELDDGNDGVCIDAVCAETRCGDGIVSAPEECDDGENAGGGPNVCQPGCVFPACGNGFVDTDFGEECDDGAANGNGFSLCTAQCLNNRCGDSYLAGAEECDDGNSSDNDACVGNCLDARCGDGFIYAGVESCDDSSVGCNNCVASTCGNGEVDLGETCDDMNSVDDDECTNSCQLARCGDGVLHSARGEECDSGLSVGMPGDPCTLTCKNNVCGDSHVGPEEQCDLGEFANGDDGENCTEFCTLNTCGDGQRGPTEECDAGPLNGTNGQDCTATCRMTTCGDGQLGTSEACDDGNSSSFDGCSESCLVENCRDFDLSAFNCPTGATQFCSSELPLSGNCPSTLNNALALAACVT
ncbi:MAG: DUF4215 domain-containing protein, partial [Myxococcota bacterium]